MDLSILIPTIKDRHNQFNELTTEINDQILKYTASAEVISLLDDGERSIGDKRNRLLEEAQGKFTVFIDDDDRISDDYIDLVCKAIQEFPDLDCIGFKGWITFSGSHLHHAHYSRLNQRFQKKSGVYYRPIMHINPVRRDIARKYPFADISYSEDIDWAMRLQREGALRHEYFIDKPLYFYQSRRKWWYQSLIDATEGFRQTLGIQIHNLVRIRRWLDKD